MTIKKWEPFVTTSTDLSKMTAVEKMNTGRYLLFTNSEIKMITGFSEYKCNFWNYMRSSATVILYNFMVVIGLNLLTLSFIY